MIFILRRSLDGVCRKSSTQLLAYIQRQQKKALLYTASEFRLLSWRRPNWHSGSVGSRVCPPPRLDPNATLVPATSISQKTFMSDPFSQFPIWPASLSQVLAQLQSDTRQLTNGRRPTSSPYPVLAGIAELTGGEATILDDFLAGHPRLFRLTHPQDGSDMMGTFDIEPIVRHREIVDGVTVSATVELEIRLTAIPPGLHTTAG